MGPTDKAQDWAHLGKTIRQWRTAAGIKRQSDLAAAVGLATKTIGNYERGRVPDTAPAIPDGYYAVAAHLGWEPNSIEHVLAGGQPALRRDPHRHTGQATDQLVEHAFQLIDAARDMGAPAEVVSRCRLSITELVGWMAHHRGQNQSDYGLAAYRPHAADEGPATDDAARIYRALHDN